ncbi:PqqD family protein [Micromonospora rubida]|uniref:PqqD family protein n=1 Tax=Micromonospora rubida TaxID=2697657 RepID=A0ABW7ST24_9ACTN
MSAPISPETVVLPRFDVRVRRVEGSFLVGFAQATYSLSESGAFLWYRIDGRRTVSQLAELLAVEYDVDRATALADTVEVVTEWHSADLIRTTPSRTRSRLTGVAGSVPAVDPATVRAALADNGLIPEPCSAVLLAGSVARGWQHARSDADLYVTSEDPWTGTSDGFNPVALVPDRVPTATCYAGDLRLEVRYWTEDQVNQMFDKVTWARFKETDNTGELLSEYEITFLGRLIDPIVLHGADWLGRRREELDASAYRSMLTLRALNDADSLVEDTLGLLESGDVPAAVLASQAALASAADALSYRDRQYGTEEKWRARRVAAIDVAALPFDRYWALVTMRDFDPSEPERWVESVLELCRTVAMEVEV